MYYYIETKLWSELGVSFFEFIVNSSVVWYQFRNVTVLNELHAEFMTNWLSGGFLHTGAGLCFSSRERVYIVPKEVPIAPVVFIHSVH